jgi:hypothetical protein
MRGSGILDWLLLGCTALFRLFLGDARLLAYEPVLIT